MKAIWSYLLFFLFLILPGFSKDGSGGYPAPKEKQVDIPEQIFSELYITNSFAFQLYVHKGMYRMKEKAYELAISNFQQALRLNPGSFEAYSLLGEAMIAMDLKNEALKAFDKAIDLNPFYANAYFHRANLFQNTGNYSQAYQDYTIAFYIDPLYLQTFEENDTNPLTFKRVLKNELKATRK